MHQVPIRVLSLFSGPPLLCPVSGVQAQAFPTYAIEEDLGLWVGFTAKVQDAEIELRQGTRSSKDTDLGFVPLLHLAADWRVTRADVESVYNFAWLHFGEASIVHRF